MGLEVTDVRGMFVPSSVRILISRQMSETGVSNLFNSSSPTARQLPTITMEPQIIRKPVYITACRVYFKISMNEPVANILLPALSRHQLIPENVQLGSDELIITNKGENQFRRSCSYLPI